MSYDLRRLIRKGIICRVCASQRCYLIAASVAFKETGAEPSKFAPEHLRRSESIGTVPTMTDLSTYVLEKLRDDGNFILSRAARIGDPRKVLVMSTAAEEPAPWLVARLDYAYSLGRIG